MHLKSKKKSLTIVDNIFQYKINTKDNKIAIPCTCLNKPLCKHMLFLLTQYHNNYKPEYSKLFKNGVIFRKLCKNLCEGNKIDFDKLNEELADQDCIICWDNLNIDYFCNQCGKAFHKKCLRQWKETTCPHCQTQTDKTNAIFNNIWVI